MTNKEKELMSGVARDLHYMAEELLKEKRMFTLRNVAENLEFLGSMIFEIIRKER